MTKRPVASIVGFVRLNLSQRKELSKALFDVGKLVVVILVLNPLISKEELGVKILSTCIGLATAFGLFSWALLLLKDEGGS